MLRDKADVVFEAGKGGAGLVSFGKMAHSGPDGGNGGKGASIYLVAESDMTLLNQFSRKTKFHAEDGTPGGKNKKTGKDGEDLIITIPVGTQVIDADTGKILFDFNYVGQKELLCVGGKGGRGNFEFRSSRRTTPMFAQPGLSGEIKNIILNLKLFADFGLIGLPNAGKSSLLNELTRSKAKIANYPFTTLSPNLGVIGKKIIADIPGLIEGASNGKGLGIAFLKHVEKVKVLLHCISSDSNDPEKDYEIVRNELKKYNKALSRKRETILITKSDLLKKQDEERIRKRLYVYGKDLITVSIYDPDSIINLGKILQRD